ncbi:MAG: hypothetical protein AB7F65_10315 [Dehalococcoidia bacterium]
MLALALCVGVLAACSDADAEEPLRPTHTALVRVTDPTETPSSAAEVVRRHDNIEVAAESFRTALLAHDLTGLTMAFAPGGLAQAQALTSRTGTQRGQGVTAAELGTLRPVTGSSERWEAIYRLDAPRGLVDLRTVWEWFDTSGWRIVAIELLT